MIEEACEAADAMDGDDEMKMADELGDVLLQVVLNSCIGAEHRAFTDRDVTSMAAHKMITRHEHVFGKAKAENAQAVVSVWENAKKKERGEQTALERVLDVPLSLPALMRGQKIVRTRGGRGRGRRSTARPCWRAWPSWPDKRAAIGRRRRRGWARCWNVSARRPRRMGWTRKPPCAGRRKSAWSGCAPRDEKTL